MTTEQRAHLDDIIASYLYKLVAHTPTIKDKTLQDSFIIEVQAVKDLQAAIVKEREALEATRIALTGLIPIVESSELNFSCYGAELLAAKEVLKCNSMN